MSTGTGAFSHRVAHEHGNGSIQPPRSGRVGAITHEHGNGSIQPPSKGQGFYTLMRLVIMVQLYMGQGFQTMMSLLIKVKMDMEKGFHTVVQ